MTDSSILFFVFIFRGNGVLSIESVFTYGVFEVTQPPASNLILAGASNTFEVTVARGQAAGQHDALVIISNSDLDESPFQFLLSVEILSTAPTLTNIPPTLSATVAQPFDVDLTPIDLDDTEVCVVIRIDGILQPTAIFPSVTVGGTVTFGDFEVFRPGVYFISYCVSDVPDAQCSECSFARFATLIRLAGFVSYLCFRTAARSVRLMRTHHLRF